MVDLDPVRGREQAGRRPGLVASVDAFNDSPADLVVILPITTRTKGIPFHVRIVPPEGGVDRESFVKCEDIRSIATERLTRRLGHISKATMNEIDDRLRILLNL